MSNSQDSPHDPPPPRTTRKRRRWLRILLVTFALLVALGFAINGPIARWLVGKIIRDQLFRKGLAGDLAVEGHLHHGFTLLDGHFTGPGALERLSFDEIGVDYWIVDLLDKKVQGVAARNLVVVATLPEPKANKAKEDGALPDFGPIGDSLRKIRPHLLPLEIDLEGIDFTLRRPQLPNLHFTLGALSHHPGSPEFAIDRIESDVLGKEGLRTQDLHLAWDPDQIRLSHAQIIPELAVNVVRIDFPVGGPVSLHAVVEALATQLEVTADDKGTVRVDLQKKALDLSRIEYFPDLELAGTVEKLSVDFANLLEKPAQWRGTATLQAINLQWPGGRLEAVEAGCALEKEISLRAAIGSDLRLEASAPRPAGDSLDVKKWMDGLVIALEVTAPSLHKALQHAMPAAGKDIPELAGIPEGAVSAEATVTLGGERGVSAAGLQWAFSNIIYQENLVPDLSGSAALADDTVSATVQLAKPRPAETIELNVTLDLDTKTYQAGLQAKLPDPAWLLPFLPAQEDPLWKPTGPIALQWSGERQLAEKEQGTHTGSLDIEALTLTAPEESVTEIKLTSTYAWPGTIEASSLSIRNGDLWLEGAAKWDEEVFSIATLRLHDQTGPLTSLEGRLPLAADKLTAKGFFSQDGPLHLKLDGRDLKLLRLAKLLPLKLPKGFGAALGYDLTIAGTPGSPTLQGGITAKEITTPGPEKIPALAATLTFTTANQRLTAIGTVTEPGGKLVDLEASLPIQLKDWLENPEHFNQLPLEANAKVNNFALQRLQPFVPALAKAEGSIQAEVRVGGPLGEPVVAGGATVTLDRYPLPNTPFRDVRNSKLVVRLDGSRLVIDPSPIHCAGGKIVLSGTIGKRNDEPDFDLQVNADHVLAWRNESFILRANGLLKLNGPLSAARLSGDIQFVESLFYKDIDLLPIGIPTANVPKPKLPKIDQKKAARIGGLPAPFKNWTLDVGVRTGDPVLIRGGNFATGKVTALARVRGTLSNPRPAGTVTIQNAWARLPLSGKLHVRQGIVTLRPDAPYDPVIDLRGAATIARYNVTLNVFGSANNPKYNLFSDPPLPESEILTLLATGTTTGDLENTDTATMKAAQLAVNWAKDRFQVPGRNTLFQRFLTELDEVQLAVGENDPFSGRKFNSATLELTNKILLSAAVDATGNTRGVVIFSVRFR